ncbi:MAG TPA: ABC transporter substrate-binding protein [Methylomirabilota bacterium]|nr:ABC transporter substrate-binding protein [Methylomirabilota bacterium]
MFITVVITAALGVTPAPAEETLTSARSDEAVAPVRPIELVRSSVGRVLAIVQSQPASPAERAKLRTEVRRVAEGLFDFNDMARRMLAQHWQEGSAQQQREFVQILTDLLERSYLTVVENFPAVAITFQDESVTGLYAQVRSRVVTERGAETAIVYRLVEIDGRWAVYDVVVDGVSLISSYRSQFNSMLRRYSFAELLDRLRNREAAAVTRTSQGP